MIPPPPLLAKTCIRRSKRIGEYLNIQYHGERDTRNIIMFGQGVEMNSWPPPGFRRVRITQWTDGRRKGVEDLSGTI